MQFGFEAGNKMSESSQHITLDGQYSVQFLVSRGYSECLFNSFKNWAGRNVDQAQLDNN